MIKSLTFFPMCLALTLGAAAAASERGRPSAVDYALFDSLKSLKDSVSQITDSNETLALENDFFRSKIAAMRRDLENLDAMKNQLQDDVSARQNYGGAQEVAALEAELARYIEEYKALVSEQRMLGQRIQAKQQNLDALRQLTRATHASIGRLQQEKSAFGADETQSYQQRMAELDAMLKQSEQSLDVQRQQKDFFRLDVGSVKSLSDAETQNKALWEEMKNLESDLRSLSERWSEQSRLKSPGYEKYVDEIAAFDRDIQDLDREKKLLETAHQEAARVIETPANDAPDDLAAYRDMLYQENERLTRQAADLRAQLQH